MNENAAKASGAAPTAHVATLMAPQPVIDRAVLARAAALLPSAAETRVLDDRIAVDLVFASAGPVAARALVEAMQAAIGPLPVDVVVQPLAARRKKLLLADMDSTMIAQECIDELADVMGLKDHVSAITERAMRGEIAFEPALKARVALLKGLPADTVDRIIAERITLTPGGRALIGTMRAHQGYTCLVSGGFTVFTARIGTAIGFDEHRSNHLDIADGKFAGTVAEPIIGREAKRETLLDLRGKFGFAAEETLAVGDGANDLAMLAEAGLGVAFHAKPKVAAEAHARIDHCDLSALLFLQGYRREEFVAG